MKATLVWPDGRLWQYRASIAQANGAGGAIVLDVANVEGSEFYVLMAKALNSGTNTLRMRRVDEDGNAVEDYLQVASGAASQGAIPRNEDDPTGDSALVSSTAPGALHFAGGDAFRIRQTGAGAQNDTLLVDWRILLRGTKPTPDISESTNPGDVTIATPTVDKVI